jgi:hypothetical protein
MVMSYLDSSRVARRLATGFVTGRHDDNAKRLFGEPKSTSSKNTPAILSISMDVGAIKPAQRRDTEYRQSVNR